MAKRKRRKDVCRFGNPDVLNIVLITLSCQSRSRSRIAWLRRHDVPVGARSTLSSASHDMTGVTTGRVAISAVRAEGENKLIPPLTNANRTVNRRRILVISDRMSCFVVCSIRIMNQNYAMLCYSLSSARPFVWRIKVVLSILRPLCSSAFGRLVDAVTWLPRRPTRADKGYPPGRESHVGGTAVRNRLFVEGAVLLSCRLSMAWPPCPLR